MTAQPAALVDRDRDQGLRGRLIEAALDLVEVSGSRGLGWREVARRADVSHSAAYRHFANLQALLAAVAEQGFASLAEGMVRQAAAAPPDSFRRLEAMAIAYVEFATEHPSHFRVMFGRDVPDIDEYPSLREAHDVANLLFRSAVLEVLDELGDLTLDLDADEFTLMAWSMIHGLASLMVDGRVGDVADANASPRDRVRSMTGLIRTLLLATGP